MPTRPARRGRRPVGEDTRGAIVDAARSEFAARGYEATSLRAIARAAGVDAALVHHYFDGKEQLFTAAMHVPLDTRAFVDDVASAGMDGAGERVLRAFFTVWEDPGRRPALLAALRAVVGSEKTASMVGGFLLGPFVGQMARRLGSPDPATSAALMASQVVGIAITRYVVRLEPIASAGVDQLVEWYAPTVQRYLEHPERLVAGSRQA